MLIILRLKSLVIKLWISDRNIYTMIEPLVCLHTDHIAFHVNECYIIQFVLCCKIIGRQSKNVKVVLTKLLFFFFMQKFTCHIISKFDFFPQTIIFDINNNTVSRRNRKVFLHFLLDWTLQLFCGYNFTYILSCYWHLHYTLYLRYVQFTRYAHIFVL